MSLYGAGSERHRSTRSGSVAPCDGRGDGEKRCRGREEMIGEKSGRGGAKGKRAEERMGSET